MRALFLLDHNHTSSHHSIAQYFSASHDSHCLIRSPEGEREVRLSQVSQIPQTGEIAPELQVSIQVQIFHSEIAKTQEHPLPAQAETAGRIGTRHGALSAIEIPNGKLLRDYGETAEVFRDDEAVGAIDATADGGRCGW